MTSSIQNRSQKPVKPGKECGNLSNENPEIWLFSVLENGSLSSGSPDEERLVALTVGISPLPTFILQQLRWKMYHPICLCEIFTGGWGVRCGIGFIKVICRSFTFYHVTNLQEDHLCTHPILEVAKLFNKLKLNIIYHKTMQNFADRLC